MDYCVVLHSGTPFATYNTSYAVNRLFLTRDATEHHSNRAVHMCNAPLRRPGSTQLTISGGFFCRFAGARTFIFGTLTGIGTKKSGSPG